MKFRHIFRFSDTKEWIHLDVRPWRVRIPVFPICLRSSFNSDRASESWLEDLERPLARALESSSRIDDLLRWKLLRRKQ